MSFYGCGFLSFLEWLPGRSNGLSDKAVIKKKKLHVWQCICIIFITEICFPCPQIPQILFYGQVCSADAGDRLIEAPGAFAPPLEGYLMCKTDKGRRFEPCYFLLRLVVILARFLDFYTKIYEITPFSRWNRQRLRLVAWYVYST